MRMSSFSRAKSANRNLKIPLRSYENYLHEDISFFSSKDVEFLSAVSLGMKNRVRHIIKKGKHNLQIRDRSGSNAVHIAAKKNDAELLKMICEKGVPASVRRRDQNAITPFIIAAKHGSIESVKYLHDEARVDIYIKDKEGQNAVHYSAMGNSLECFSYLVKEAKISYKDCNTVNGNTVLHTAAKHGSLSIVRYCCETLKLDPHQFNYESKSPLRFATENNHFHIVVYLVSVWNVSVFLPDDKNVTIIAYAARYEHLLKIFKFFASVVASESLVEGDLLLTRSIESPPLTPLKAAIKYKNKNAIDLILQQNEMRRKLYVKWIAKHSPILSKLSKTVIENMSKYT